MVVNSPVPPPLFKAIGDIDARRGYKRCSLPGLGVSFPKGPQATTDFWRGKSGEVVVRFSSQGYVYCYEVTQACGAPMDDDYVDSVLAESVRKLLLAWLVDGPDDSPLYCDEE
jgi:hypothetical protein